MKVSVIIPSTGNRFDFLQRAIKSCIFSSKNIQIEIIVVINGRNGKNFDFNSTVKSNFIHYYYLEEGNVSLARNYGVKKSSGDLIRFLDDDDYLYTNISYRQYLDFYENENLDISMYNFDIVDDLNNVFKTPCINEVEDFVSYALDPLISLPFCFVYRANIIRNIQWDNDVKIPEDEDFLRRIAKKGGGDFKIRNEKVGVWYQHNGERLSLLLVNNEYYFNKFNSIKDLYIKIEDSSYSLFAAQGMWKCIHGGFYLSPIYWTQIALYARKLDPTSKPQEKFFHKLPDFIHPIVVEWLMLPKRWLTHQLRILRKKLGLISYIRKL